MDDIQPRSWRKPEKFTAKGFLLLICALILAAAIPFAVLAGVALTGEKVYAQTYYAALQCKYDRLCQTEGKRLVVIGGSATAFGIDSKIAEKELGYPCVNFGLYAALGLGCMLDLSLPQLHKGDLVVIAPEYSSQMFSDYVGYTHLLQAMEGRGDMALALGTSYLPGLLQELPAHMAAEKELKAAGGVKPAGVYSLSAFDAYGDIIYDRPDNIMDGRVSADNLPQINGELVTDEFADMINDYVRSARGKGAQVYFGFCPVNELAVEQAQDVDAQGFCKALEEKLDCPVISSLDDHIMDAGYFYDSNFHMNNAGAVYNTVLLVNDIKRITGKMEPTQTPIPAPVAGEEETDVISEGRVDGLCYEIVPEGAVITDLDDDGMKAAEITVPETIEGVPVYKIGTAAFAGCQATTITIPSTVTVLSGKLFERAASLEQVFLNATQLPQVGSGLMEGAESSVRILVPAAVYGDYVTDYFWANYASWLETQ